MRILSLFACFLFLSVESIAEPLNNPRFAPVVPKVYSIDMALLGRDLFNDPVLSGNNEISCASCHDLSAGGSDGKPTSIGFDGKPMARNSLTIFNSSLNFCAGWKCLANNLTDHAVKVMTNKSVMGNNNIEDIAKRVASVDEYVERFAQIYGSEGVTGRRIAESLAAFQTSQTGTNSLFDLFIQGIERDGEPMLSRLALEGLKNFEGYACSGCHFGPNLGGQIMQSLGFLNETDILSDCIDSPCRVPSLRYVVQTPPYFDKGNVETLEEAIRLMGKLQTNNEMSDRAVKSIIALFETFPGNIRPLD